MYEIYLERSAESNLKRLPTTIFHRIIPRIKTLAQSARPSGCRKIAGSKNDWRIRIGLVTIVSFTRSMRKPRP